MSVHVFCFAFCYYYLLLFALLLQGALFGLRRRSSRTPEAWLGGIFFHVCYAYLFINNLFYNYRTKMEGLDDQTLAAINDVWAKELGALDLPAITNDSSELPALMSV